MVDVFSHPTSPQVIHRDRILTIEDSLPHDSHGEVVQDRMVKGRHFENASRSIQIDQS